MVMAETFRSIFVVHVILKHVKIYYFRWFSKCLLRNYCLNALRSLFSDSIIFLKSELHKMGQSTHDGTKVTTLIKYTYHSWYPENFIRWVVVLSHQHISQRVIWTSFEKQLTRISKQTWPLPTFRWCRDPCPPSGSAHAYAAFNLTRGKHFDMSLHLHFFFVYPNSISYSVS